MTVGFQIKRGLEKTIHQLDDWELFFDVSAVSNVVFTEDTKKLYQLSRNGRAEICAEAEYEPKDWFERFYPKRLKDVLDAQIVYYLHPELHVYYKNRVYAYRLLESFYLGRSVL